VHDGEFVATIAGANRPGVRIVTKHAIIAKPTPDDCSRGDVLEVAIAAS